MSDKDVEQTIADWRERANALRVTGHAHDAKLIDQVLADVTEPLAEYLAWLPESSAMLYEGLRTPDSLRARFTDLEARGLARWHNRQRYYRRIALRHRGCPEASREAGRRAARGAA